jgi:hypothetical protein
MDIKLTNGRKIIIKDKKYYEANLGHFTRNGFVPVDGVKKKIKETVKEISDKVVELKSKRKKNVKKAKKKV